jgi:hypothetical protein
MVFMPGFQYSINSYSYAQYFAAVREKERHCNCLFLSNYPLTQGYI